MVPAETSNPQVAAVTDALDRLRRGAVEPCVLTLLASGPAYSHDIVRTLAGVPGMLTSEGTVYPMLSRLRRAGLVQTSWQESPNGPPRRYYELTAEGRHAVSAFAEAWQTFRRGVDQIISGRAGAGPPTNRSPARPADPAPLTSVEETT
jgi:PadR family transcriptional regulator PadR